MNNMTKYKIVKESKALPEGWEVGDEVREGWAFKIKNEDVHEYTVWVKNKPKAHGTSRQHLNALIELGVVEEVKEWNPRELKVGDRYWRVLYQMAEELEWCGDKCDIWLRALGNCHPTKEAAEQWRDRIISEYENK